MASSKSAVLDQHTLNIVLHRVAQLLREVSDSTLSVVPFHLILLEDVLLISVGNLIP